MDLQSRKLSLIEYLIHINDEDLLTRIEMLISKSSKEDSKIYKVLSKEDLIARANESNEDYKSGKFISQKQLEKDSENW
jgi:hypothetical protein